jgi:Domain of unknown function (DUF1508)
MAAKFEIIAASQGYQTRESADKGIESHASVPVSRALDHLLKSARRIAVEHMADIARTTSSQSATLYLDWRQHGGH